MAKYKQVNGMWVKEGEEKFLPSLTNRSLVDVQRNTTMPDLKSTQKNVDVRQSQLKSARKEYSDYIQSQLKGKTSNKLPVVGGVQDLTSTRNALQESVSKNYKAIQKASSTERAKELKKKVSEKQNAYNYAKYREREQEVSEDKVGFLDKLLTPISSGAQNIVDFSKLTGTTNYVDKQGNKTYLPTKSDLKYQKVREESGTIAKVYGDVAYNLTQAGVAKAIDVFTGSPSGSILYYGNIMTDSVEEAKNRGFDDKEALLYGTSTTVVAGLLDKFVSNLGGLTKVSSKVPTLEVGLDKIFNRLLKNKTASLLFSNVTSEAISEGIEKYVGNALAYVIDKDTREQESFLDMLIDTTPDAMYSALIGGLSGGVSTGLNINSDEFKTRKESLEEYKNTLEKIEPKTMSEAKYKNDQLNAVDNLYQEMERIAEEQTQKTAEEPMKTAEEPIKQEEVKQEEVKEPTYKNAKNIETYKEGKSEYTAYYGVPLSDSKEYGNKKYNDVTQQELNDMGVELITYGDNEKNIYEFQNKKDLFKYVKSAGGFKELSDATQWSIKSTTNEGEFYLVRDKMAKNGWKWEDVNSDEVKGFEYAKRYRDKNIIDEKITEAKSENINTTLAEKQVDAVLTITENLNDKETDKLINMVVPTSETKKVVNLNDGKKYIDTNKEYDNVDELIKTSENSVSTREIKEVERENKKRRKGYDNRIEALKNDPDAVAYLENRRDENLYDVRHTNKNVMEETLKLVEDPEHYYNTTMEEYSKAVENNELKDNVRMSLLEKFEALMDYYGDYNSGHYNGVISRDISDIYAELGTNPAQELAVRSAWMKNNPRAVPLRTSQTLRQMFNQEAKKHKNDIAWLEQNDPKKNPNSPYKLNDKQFNTINYYANELSKIENKDSIEYKKMKMNLDSYIQNVFGSFTLSSAFKKATTLNVLASTRIWFSNIKGNIWNVPQLLIDRIPKVMADKIISNQTGIRTSGVSIIGDTKSALRGFKRGLSESFFEFKHDVTLDKFGNKYLDTTSDTDFNELGEKHTTFRFSESSKIGKLMNKYAKTVNFFMNVGDRPFAYMYYEQSIYNQRLSQARINATNEKTNYIYKVNENTKTGKYTVSFIDASGKRNVQSMNKSQYDVFIKENKVQDITESMCEIAEQEALENTFQDENKVTKLALKFKSTLNESVHFGEFGLGDIMLKFTTTGSNMAKSLYEHSPLETITLIKDIKVLNENIKLANKNNTKIDAKLQHKVASDIGKLIGGMITTTSMAALLSTGLLDIEGKEEDDKKGKFKSSTTGSMPYSIQLGKYNYNLDAGSTFSGLLKTGTDIGKLLEEGNNLLQSIFGGSETLVNEMIDVSFVNNVLDLTNTKYSSLIENFTQQLASQPANLIPSFMKDIAVFVDGFTERQVYDDNPFKYMYNQIVNRVPYLRGSGFGLDAKVDSWGELKTVGGDTLASIYNTLISAGTFKRIKSDDVSNEIMRVYTSTTNTDAIPKLSMSQSYFKYNKKQYDLTEDEKNTLMQSYSKYSHKAVKKLISKSVYKNATDENKIKLLQKAYDYADEMSKKDYVESKGEKYYNFASKDGKYTQYKKTAFEEIIDNNISIEEANYKRQYNNSYKLKTSIIDWETYNEIQDDIQEIQETYSNDNGYDFKTRKQAVQLYIRDLKGMSNVQKAMLSKIENSKGDYSDYDNAIKNYIDTLDLTDEEYEYVYEQLGLGGYWGMYWKKK